MTSPEQCSNTRGRALVTKLWLASRNGLGNIRKPSKTTKRWSNCIWSSTTWLGSIPLSMVVCPCSGLSSLAEALAAALTDALIDNLSQGRCVKKELKGRRQDLRACHMAIFPTTLQCVGSRFECIPSRLLLLLLLPRAPFLSAVGLTVRVTVQWQSSSRDFLQSV